LVVKYRLSLSIPYRILTGEEWDRRTYFFLKRFFQFPTGFSHLNPVAASGAAT